MYRLVTLACVVLLGIAAAAMGQRPGHSTLSLVIEEVRYEGIALDQVIEDLRQATGGNFHVNWRALDAVGVMPDTPVTVRARRLTVRKFLQLTLGQLTNGQRLSVYNDAGVVELTTRELAHQVLVTRVYNVDDLLFVFPTIDRDELGLGDSDGRGGDALRQSRSRSDYGSSSRSRLSPSRSGGGVDDDVRRQRMEELSAVIEALIEPPIWRENGGPASIGFFRGNLVVTAPRRIHERIGAPSSEPYWGQYMSRRTHRK